MLLENNHVQAVLKQDLIYTDCVTDYLNYLTEESNKNIVNIYLFQNLLSLKINIKMCMINPMQS